MAAELCRACSRGSRSGMTAWDAGCSQHGMVTAWDAHGWPGTRIWSLPPGWQLPGLLTWLLPSPSVDNAEATQKSFHPAKVSVFPSFSLFTLTPVQLLPPHSGLRGSNPSPDAISTGMMHCPDLPGLAAGFLSQSQMLVVPLTPSWPPFGAGATGLWGSQAALGGSWWCQDQDKDLSPNNSNLTFIESFKT